MNRAWEGDMRVKGNEICITAVHEVNGPRYEPRVSNGLLWAVNQYLCSKYNVYVIVYGMKTVEIMDLRKDMVYPATHDEAVIRLEYERVQADVDVPYEFFRECYYVEDAGHMDYVATSMDRQALLQILPVKRTKKACEKTLRERAEVYVYLTDQVNMDIVVNDRSSFEDLLGIVARNAKEKVPSQA